MSCAKREPDWIDTQPDDTKPTVNINKNEILKKISDGIITAEDTLKKSDVRHVNSTYSVNTGAINYTIYYKANYAARRQESEIYLKVFDNNEHSNRAYIYYHKGNLFIETPFEQQKLENFGSTNSFDLFYEAVTMFDYSDVIIGNTTAQLFNPDNVGASIGTLIDQERISYIKVTENSESIEMTDIDLNVGPIKNPINNMIKDTFSPFEKKFDLLTLKYLGLRLSDVAILEVSTAKGDMVNVQLTDSQVRTFIFKATGALTDGISNYEIGMRMTAHPGTASLNIPDSENPYLSPDYEEMKLGHFNYKGVMIIPALEAEYDATFRAILSSTDNTVNQVIFTLQNIATREIESALYYKDQLLFADITGIQRLLNGAVELEKLNLPKVKFSGFNMAQELSLLINKAVRLVQSASGDDLYGENKELLMTFLDHVESDESASTIYITITKELMREFNNGVEVDFVTMLAEKLGVAPEMLKQLFGENSMENARLVVSYNVDTGRIGLTLYDDDYMIFDLYLDKTESQGGDQLIYPASFIKNEHLEFIVPANTIIEMTGTISMQEVSYTDFDKLFGALMGDISGKNTPFRLRSNEQFDFILNLMQEYEYIEKEGGITEQIIYQTMRFELFKGGALQLAVYSSASDPDYLYVHFNIPIGPEGETRDGLRYEKRTLKYRILRAPVSAAFDELLGTDNIFSTPNIMDMLSKITSAVKNSPSMKMRFTDNGLTVNLHKDPIKELIGLDNLYSEIGVKIKFANKPEEKLVVYLNKAEYPIPSISPPEAQVAESIYSAKWHEFAYVYFTPENPMMLKLTYIENSIRIVSGNIAYTPQSKLLGEIVQYYLSIEDEVNGTKIVKSLIDPNTPGNANAILGGANVWYIDPSKTERLPDRMPVLFVDNTLGAVHFSVEDFDPSNITLAGMVDYQYQVIIGKGSIAELRFIISIGVLGRAIIPVNGEHTYPDYYPVVGEIIVDPYTYAIRKEENSSWTPLPNVLKLVFEKLTPKSAMYYDYLMGIYDEAEGEFPPLVPDATQEVIDARLNQIRIRAWELAYERALTPEDLYLQMKGIFESYSTTAGEIRHRAWAELILKIEQAIEQEESIPNEENMSNIVWDFDYNSIQFNGGFTYAYTNFNNLRVALKVYIKSKIIQHIRFVDIVNTSITDISKRPFTEEPGMYTVDVLESGSYIFPTESNQKQEIRLYFTDGTYRIIGRASRQPGDENYYNIYLPIALQWKHPVVSVIVGSGSGSPLGEEDRNINTAVIGENYTIGTQVLSMMVFEPARTLAGIGYAETLSGVVTGYGRAPTGDYNYNVTAVEQVSPTRASFIKDATTYGDFFEINPYNIQPLPNTIYIEVLQGGQARRQRKPYPVTWIEDDILIKDEYGNYWLRNVSLSERLLRVRGTIGDGSVKLTIVMIVKSLSAAYESIIFDGLAEGVSSLKIDPYASYTLPWGYTIRLTGNEEITFNNVNWAILLGSESQFSQNRWMLQFFGRNYSWLYDYILYRNALADNQYYEKTLAEIIPEGFSEPTEAEYAYFMSCIAARRIPVTSSFVFPHTGGNYTIVSRIEGTDRIIEQDVSLTLNVSPRTLVTTNEENATRVDILNAGASTARERYTVDGYLEDSKALLNRITELKNLNTLYQTTAKYVETLINRLTFENPAVDPTQIRVMAYNEYYRTATGTELQLLESLYYSASGNSDDDKKVSAILQYIERRKNDYAKGKVGLYFGDVAETSGNKYNLNVYWLNLDNVISALKSPDGAVLGVVLEGYIGYGEANQQLVRIPFYVDVRRITEMNFVNINSYETDIYEVNYDFAYNLELVNAIEDAIYYNENININNKPVAVYDRVYNHRLTTAADKALLSAMLLKSGNYSTVIAEYKALKGESSQSILRSIWDTVVLDNSGAITQRFTTIYARYTSSPLVGEYDRRILQKLYDGFSVIENSEERYEATMREFVALRADNARTIKIELKKPMGLKKIGATGDAATYFESPSDFFKEALKTISLTFSDRTEGYFNPVFEIPSYFDRLILATDLVNAEIVTEFDGTRYAYFRLIINNLSAGSTENAVILEFKAIVDQVSGLSGSPTPQELEPFDEKGDAKYPGGFTLPNKIEVNYKYSGTVVFGNIGVWTVDAGVRGYSSGSSISVIPVEAINVFNPNEAIRLKKTLPCEQGEYIYSITFPRKYLGETYYRGDAADRNYSMLDIEMGVITIDDVYSIYQSAGTGVSTVEFILRNLPKVITAIPYSYDADVHFDGIAAVYDYTLVNTYELSWVLQDRNMVIDHNGTNGEVLFARANLFSYYYITEAGQIKELIQTVDLYINVKPLTNPVIEYDGLVAREDMNVISFDPYDTSSVYNGRLTLPVDGLKVYFNNNISDIHTFNASDKLNYYLKLQDADMIAKSLLYQTYLGGNITAAEETAIRKLYQKSLIANYAQKQNISEAVATTAILADSFDDLLSASMLTGSALQLAQKQFTFDFARATMSTLYGDKGFSDTAAFDTLFATSLTTAQRQEIFAAYFAALSSSYEGLPNDLLMLFRVYSYLYGYESEFLGQLSVRFLNALSVTQKAVFKRNIYSLYQVGFQEAEGLLGNTGLVGDAYDAAVFDKFMENRIGIARILVLLEYLKRDSAVINMSGNTGIDLDTTAKAFVTLRLAGISSNQEILTFATAMDALSYEQWNMLPEPEAAQLRVLKGHIFVAYAYKVMASGGTFSIASLMDLYLSLSSEFSKETSKERVASNLINNYAYPNNELLRYFAPQGTALISAAQLMLAHARAYVESAESFVYTSSQDSWRLNKAKMEVWDQIVSTMTQTQIDRLLPSYNEPLYSRVYDLMLSDGQYSTPFGARLQNLYSQLPGTESARKGSAVQTLYNESPVTARALIMKAIYTVENNIRETERPVYYIDYTQSGHSISEIMNNILYLYLILPDGLRVEITLHIFSREISQVTVPNKVTDAEGNEREELLSFVYYIDPYNSATFRLPDTAKFIFESGDDLTLSLRNWENYDSSAFYFRGGALFYRQNENSYKGGTYELTGYLTYGTGENAEKQYFKILVVVLNRSLRVDYVDNYFYENPVAGRVKDIPSELVQEMFVDAAIYYEAAISNFVTANKLDEIQGFDIQTLYYLTYGMPLLPEIDWTRRAYNSGGIEDSDINVAGGFQKQVQGYITTDNSYLQVVYANVYDRIYATYATYTKPAAWNRLFDIQPNGTRDVKTAFTGTTRSVIKALDDGIFETLYIMAWAWLVTNPDVLLRETALSVESGYRNDPTITMNYPYPDADERWYAVFFKVIRNRAGNHSLGTDESYIWSPLSAQYNVLQAMNMDALRLEAWDTLYNSATLTQGQKTTLDSYLAQEYSGYRDMVLISTWDAVYNEVNEREAAVMTQTLNALIQFYGNNEQGIRNAKKAAWAAVLNDARAQKIWGETAEANISAKQWSLYQIYKQLGGELLTEIEFNEYAASSTQNEYYAIIQELNTLLISKLENYVEECKELFENDYKMLALAALIARLEADAFYKLTDIDSTNSNIADEQQRFAANWDSLITAIKTQAGSAVDEALARNSGIADPEHRAYLAWTELYQAADAYWGSIMDSVSQAEGYQAALADYKVLRSEYALTDLIETLGDAYGVKGAEAWQIVKSTIGSTMYGSEGTVLTEQEILDAEKRDTLKDAWEYLYEISNSSDRSVMLNILNGELGTLPEGRRWAVYVTSWTNYKNNNAGNTIKRTLIERIENYYVLGYGYTFEKISENPAIVGETIESLNALYNSVYNELGAQDVPAKSEVVARLKTLYNSEIEALRAEYLAGVYARGWEYIVDKYISNATDFVSYMRIYTLYNSQFALLPASLNLFNMNSVKAIAWGMLYEIYADTEYIRETALQKAQALIALSDLIKAEAAENYDELSDLDVTDEISKSILWSVLEEQASQAVKNNMPKALTLAAKELSVSLTFLTAELAAEAYEQLLEISSGSERQEILSIVRPYLIAGTKAILWDTFYAKYPAAHEIKISMAATLAAVPKENGETVNDDSVKAKAWNAFISKNSTPETLRTELNDAYRAARSARRYEIALQLAKYEGMAFTIGFEAEARRYFKEAMAWDEIYVGTDEAQKAFMNEVYSYVNTYFGESVIEKVRKAHAFKIITITLNEGLFQQILDNDVALINQILAIPEAERAQMLDLAEAQIIQPSSQLDLTRALAAEWTKRYNEASPERRLQMGNPATEIDKADKLQSESYRNLLSEAELFDLEVRIDQIKISLVDNEVLLEAYKLIGNYYYQLEGAYNSFTTLYASVKNRYEKLYLGGAAAEDNLIRIMTVKVLAENGLRERTAVLESLLETAKTDLQKNLDAKAWDTLYAWANGKSLKGVMDEAMANTMQLSSDTIRLRALDMLYERGIEEASSEIQGIIDAIESTVHKSKMWDSMFTGVDGLEELLTDIILSVADEVTGSTDYVESYGSIFLDEEEIFRYLSWNYLEAKLAKDAAYLNYLNGIKTALNGTGGYNNETQLILDSWDNAYNQAKTAPPGANQYGLDLVMDIELAAKSGNRSAAWNTLIARFNESVAAKAEMESLQSRIRGENSHLTDQEIDILCFSAMAGGAYASYIGSALNELKNGAYLKIFDEYQGNNVFLNVIAEQYKAFNVTYSAVISGAEVWNTLIQAAKDIFNDYTSGARSYGEDELKELALNYLAENLEGDAQRLLEYYVGLTETGLTEIEIKALAFDILNYNSAPARKAKLRALLPENYTDADKAAALDAYIAEQNQKVEDEILSYLDLGELFTFNTLSDEQKLEIYDAIYIKEDKWIQLYAIDYVEGLWQDGTSDTTEGRMTIFWSKDIFLDGESETTDLGSIYVGNAYKGIEHAFEISNIRYTKRQILIQGLDFYGELETAEGTMRFYNEYVVDTMGGYDFTRAQAAAYGTIGGGPLVFIGNVDVEFDNDILDYELNGYYSAQITATVRADNNAEGQKLTVTVHYLDRRPVKYYIGNQNYTNEILDTDLDLYPLFSDRSTSKHIVRIDPTSDKVFDMNTKTYILPQALSVEFSEEYYNPLVNALIYSGAINKRIDISNLAWDLMGKEITLAGLSNADALIAAYDLNGVRYNRHHSMNASFWNIQVEVDSKNISGVYSLERSGAKANEFAMPVAGGISAISAIDPFNYQTSFPENIFLRFADGSNIEILGITWKYFQGRGPDYLKDPDVISGAVGEANMYITAGFEFMNSTIWINFPIKKRHIDITAGGEQVQLLDGGTIYLIKGMDVREQLSQYSALFYNFSESSQYEDWSSVPLEFLNNDITQISTAEVGIYSNIRGRLGPNNDPNVLFTVIVVDPKLYEESITGLINDKVYYDRLITAVNTYGNRVSGKESEEGFLPDKLVQREIRSNEGYLITAYREFDIYSLVWDIAGKVVRITCEYEFMTMDNDYTLLSSNYTVDENGTGTVSRKLYFTVNIPLDTYVYSNLDESLTLEQPQLEKQLGSEIKLSDLPKGVMNAGRDNEFEVPLMWDLGSLNMTRAGVYDVYGYYRDYSSVSLSKSKHLSLILNKLDISDQITNMYALVQTYTGLNIVFVPVVPQVIRDGGGLGQLSIGREIIVEYINRERYLSGDLSSFRSTPYRDAGEYFVRVTINDYNAYGEKIFPFTILPVEVSSEDIEFVYGSDAVDAQLSIPNWPQSLAEKDRKYYDQYRLLAQRAEDITLPGITDKVEYAKAMAYRNLYNSIGEAGQELLLKQYQALYEAYFGAGSALTEEQRERRLYAMLWDAITPDGLNPISLGSAWTTDGSTRVTISVEAETALRAEGAAVNTANIATRSYTILMTRAVSPYLRALNKLGTIIRDSALADALTLFTREGNETPLERLVTARAVDLVRMKVYTLFAGYPNYLTRQSAYDPSMSDVQILIAEQALLEDALKAVLWNEVNETGLASKPMVESWPFDENTRKLMENEASAVLAAAGQQTTDIKIKAKAYDLLLGRVSAKISTILNMRFNVWLYEKYINYDNFNFTQKQNAEEDIRVLMWNSINKFNIGSSARETNTTKLIPLWPVNTLAKEKLLDNVYISMVENAYSAQQEEEFDKAVRIAAYDALYVQVYLTAQELLESKLMTLIYQEYPAFDEDTVENKLVIINAMKANVWTMIEPGETVIEKNYVYDGQPHMPSVVGMPQARILDWPQTVEEKDALLELAKNESISFTLVQAKEKAYDNLLRRISGNEFALQKLEGLLSGVLQGAAYTDYWNTLTPYEVRMALLSAAKAETWDTLPVGENATVEEVYYTFLYRYTDMSNRLVVSETRPVAAGRYEIIIVIEDSYNVNYKMKEEDVIKTTINIERASINQNFVNSMVYTGQPILPISEGLFTLVNADATNEEPELYDEIIKEYTLPDGVSISYTFFEGGREVNRIKDAGEYTFNAVVSGGNNYPSWTVESQAFTIQKRKMLVDIGTVESGYLEDIKPLSGSAVLRGRPASDDRTSFGEIVAQSVVTSRHTVGEYAINFVGFRQAGGETIYYLNPVGDQKGLEQMNILFGNYDISVRNGTYIIRKARENAVIINDAAEFATEYAKLKNGDTALWYLSPGNYGSFTMDKDIALTLIGCYDVASIGSVDSINNEFDRMKEAAPLIASSFDEITVVKGSLALDIIKFEGRPFSQSMIIGKDAGYIEIRRSGFINTPAAGMGKQNAVAIYIEPRYARRVTVSETYIAGFRTGVGVSELASTIISTENNLEILNSRFNDNDFAVYAQNGNIHIEGTRFEYGSDRAITLNMHEFIITGCEFIGNYIAVATRSTLVSDLLQSNSYRDNVTNVTDTF